MKQIRKYNIFILLVINFLIAAFFSSIIVNLTPERNIIKLSLDLNLENKETDYFKTKKFFPTFKHPFDFMEKLDKKLRDDDLIYDLKNECKNLKRLKKTLPISITQLATKLDITITSVDKDSLENCSSFIVEQVGLYNERVRKRYKENYYFFEKLNTSKKKAEKNTDETINELFLIYDDLINEYLSLNSETTIPLREELTMKDIILIRSYIEMKLFFETKKMNQSQNITIPKQKEFFAVIENIAPLKIGKKTRSVSSPPDFYKIFLSIFVFATLILLIIKYLPTNLNFKKIFN